MYRLDLYDGKYTIIFDGGGKGESAIFHALRYGVPWRDLCGDNLILQMLLYIQDLEQENKRLKEANNG